MDDETSGWIESFISFTMSFTIQERGKSCMGTLLEPPQGCKAKDCSKRKYGRWGQGKEEDADETIINNAGIGEKEAWCTTS
jgi:hypothetical protein